MLTMQGGDPLVGGLPIIHITYQQYIANPSAYEDPDVIVHISGFPTAGNMPADYVGYDSNLNMEDIGNIATKAIAKVEPSDTALYLHNVGEYFINKDGDVCKVDLQIPVNGTITLGTNCHVLSKGVANDINSNLDHRGTHECFGFGAGFSWGQCIAIFTPFDITDYTVSVSDVWVGSSSSLNISIPSADITNVTKHGANCITINISTSALNLTDYPRLCSAKITLS